MILDNAIYVDGRREITPDALEGIYETCRERRGLAWVDLYDPSPEQFDLILEEFRPHRLMLEDANKSHQRPKIERYGDLIFVVLIAARYTREKKGKEGRRNGAGKVKLEEIKVFVGPDFVVTVTVPLDESPPSPEASTLRQVHRRVDHAPALLRGPTAVLHEIVEQVVGGFGPVVEALEDDIDRIENEVFDGHPGVSRRIYELFREVIQFQRAAKPLAEVLDRVLEDEDGALTSRTRRHVRDIHNRALKITEQVDNFRDLLTNILNVNLAQIGVDQNNQMKRISAWGAIVIVPTLIAGIYGINFDYMPELDWRYGYLLAISLMALIAFALYLGFKRRHWL